MSEKMTRYTGHFFWRPIFPDPLFGKNDPVGFPGTGSFFMKKLRKSDPSDGRISGKSDPVPGHFFRGGTAQIFPAGPGHFFKKYT